MLSTKFQIDEMIRLLDSTGLQKAAASFRNVFSSFDVFDFPFANPSHKYVLLGLRNQPSPDEFEAIAKAAAGEGDQTALQLLRGGEDDREVCSLALEYTLDSNPFVWDPSAFQPEMRDALAPVTEYAIVATDGGWGVLISEDWITVASGPESFIRALDPDGTRAEGGVEEFLRYMNQMAAWSSADRDFVRTYGLGLLAKVVGRPEAEVLMADILEA